MNDDKQNPYASPQTDAVVAAENSENVLRVFGSRSILLMIVLVLVTLGLYVNFWVHRFATTLNQRPGPGSISMGLVGTFWAVSLGSLFWTVPEILFERQRVVMTISSALYWADLILTLMIAFTIRRQLNFLIRVPRNHRAWFHGFWTFLFTYFYLQWKINRNLQYRQLPEQRVAAAPGTPSFDFLADSGSKSNEG